MRVNRLSNKAKSLIMLLRDEISEGSHQQLRDLKKLSEEVEAGTDTRLQAEMILDHMLIRSARDHLETVKLLRELKAFYSHKKLEV